MSIYENLHCIPKYCILQYYITGSLGNGKWESMLVLEQDYSILTVLAADKLLILYKLLGGANTHLAAATTFPLDCLSDLDYRACQI